MMNIWQVMKWQERELYNADAEIADDEAQES